MVITDKIFGHKPPERGRLGWRISDAIKESQSSGGTEDVDLYFDRTDAANMTPSRLDLGNPHMNSFATTTNFRESLTLGPLSPPDASQRRAATAAGRILPDDISDLSDDISRVPEVAERLPPKIAEAAYSTPSSMDQPEPGVPRYVPQLESDDDPQPEPQGAPQGVPDQENVIEEVDYEIEPPEFDSEPVEPQEPEIREPLGGSRQRHRDSAQRDADPGELVRQAQQEYQPQLLNYDEDSEDEYVPSTRKRQRTINNYEPQARVHEDMEYTLDAEDLPEPDYKCPEPEPVFEAEVDRVAEEDELVDEMVVGELEETVDAKFRPLEIESDSDSGSDAEAHASDDEIDIPSDFDVDAPREARTRVPRIASWRGERINYVFDPKTGTQTVESVHVVEEDAPPAARPRAAAKPKRALKPISLNHVRTNEVEASLFDQQRQEYSQQVLARSLDGNAGYEVAEDTGVFMSSLLPESSPVVMGQLRIVRGGKMPRRNSGQFWYSFIVLAGKIVMEVGSKQLLLQRESVVSVPAGNFYEFENVAPGQSRMLMIQAGSQEEVEVQASRSMSMLEDM